MKKRSTREFREGQRLAAEDKKYAAKAKAKRAQNLAAAKRAVQASRERDAQRARSEERARQQAKQDRKNK